jgi:transposase-like protein
MVRIGLPAPSCSRGLCPGWSHHTLQLRQLQRDVGPALLIPVNNPLERIMREIRRRTRVVGAFPDGNSAINLAAARLRHIAGTRWSTERYLNMELLRQRNAMIA